MFADRFDAGRQLARRLLPLAQENPVVLGLPRGGVPVAFEVAQALEAPLDVIVVRKLGVPFQPELAMGAVAESGVEVLDHEVLTAAHVSADRLAAVEARERAEVEERIARWRRDRPAVPVAGRVVVVVDDGLATGSTARAACRVARARGASRVVLAVPVAPPETVRSLREEGETVVALHTPRRFRSVGEWFDDFGQTSDDEVAALLARAGAPGAVREEDVELAVDGVALGGRWAVPDGARGLVIFAHGSGSSRHSPRNRYVAGVLARAGLATLLFDLLTLEEQLHRANVFDVPLLARRLTAVTQAARPGFAWVGYFGASTGAAAALCAAAAPDADVAAVVSRGGRPDLAAHCLPAVRSPVLLLVGQRDETVLQLNRAALRRLTCPGELLVVPDATHLFEEPGALAAVAAAARDWFLEHAPQVRAAT